MIITILRQKYLALIDSKHRHRRRCCTPRLIQMFKWLSSDCSNTVQLTREETQLKFLGEHALDAMHWGNALRASHTLGTTSLFQEAVK